MSKTMQTNKEQNHTVANLKHVYSKEIERQKSKRYLWYLLGLVTGYLIERFL